MEGNGVTEVLEWGKKCWNQLQEIRFGCRKTYIRSSKYGNSKILEWFDYYFPFPLSRSCLLLFLFLLLLTLPGD